MMQQHPKATHKTSNFVYPHKRNRKLKFVLLIIKFVITKSSYAKKNKVATTGLRSTFGRKRKKGEKKKKEIDQSFLRKYVR